MALARFPRSGHLLQVRPYKHEDSTYLEGNTSVRAEASWTVTVAEDARAARRYVPSAQPGDD